LTSPWFTIRAEATLLRLFRASGATETQLNKVEGDMARWGATFIEVNDFSGAGGERKKCGPKADVKPPQRHHPWPCATINNQRIYCSMPDKVYGLSQHLGTLCVTHDTNVHKLGAKLGIDPGELLRMINGKVVPTKAVIEGLAKQLDSDPSYLEQLAEEIRKDLGK
jgi:hypothetical protein